MISRSRAANTAYFAIEGLPRTFTIGFPRCAVEMRPGDSDRPCPGLRAFVARPVSACQTGEIRCDTLTTAPRSTNNAALTPLAIHKFVDF